MPLDVWSGGVLGPVAMQTSHGLQSLLTNSAPSPALLQRIETEYLTAADENAFINLDASRTSFWLSSCSPESQRCRSGSSPGRMTPLEAVTRRLVRHFAITGG